MTPWKQFKQNVYDRPEDFILGDFYWSDKLTGWNLWHCNGYWFYHLTSPGGGDVSLTLFEKLQVKPLMNWWACGSMRKGERV